jgi:hypothetical protein
MEYLALYSQKCKDCKSLDPEASNLYTSCHFENGNKECPAQEVQLVVVGLASRLAKEFVAAKVNADLSAQSKILQRVSTKTRAFQHKFNEIVNRKS